MNTTLALSVFTSLLLCCIQCSSAQDDVTVTSEPINNQSYPDAGDVFQYIMDTVKRTIEGINATDLGNAAKFVRDNAARLTVDVSANDIDKAILQAAVRFHLEAEVQAFLNNKEQDPDLLTSDVMKIDEALKLWEALADFGNNVKESNVNATLAATSFIADKILTLLPTLVNDVVNYSKANDIKGTVDKPASIVVRRNDEEVISSRNRRAEICITWDSSGVCVKWKVIITIPRPRKWFG